MFNLCRMLSVGAEMDLLLQAWDEHSRSDKLDQCKVFESRSYAQLFMLVCAFIQHTVVGRLWFTVIYVGLVLEGTSQSRAYNGCFLL